MTQDGPIEINDLFVRGNRAVEQTRQIKALREQEAEAAKQVLIERDALKLQVSQLSVKIAQLEKIVTIRGAQPPAAPITEIPRMIGGWTEQALPSVPVTVAAPTTTVKTVAAPAGVLTSQGSEWKHWHADTPCKRCAIGILGMYSMRKATANKAFPYGEPCLVLAKVKDDGSTDGKGRSYCVDCARAMFGGTIDANMPPEFKTVLNAAAAYRKQNGGQLNGPVQTVAVAAPAVTPETPAAVGGWLDLPDGATVVNAPTPAPTAPAAAPKPENPLNVPSRVEMIREALAAGFSMAEALQIVS